jgi:hypothetical protein
MNVSRVIYFYFLNDLKFSKPLFISYSFHKLINGFYYDGILFNRLIDFR